MRNKTIWGLAFSTLVLAQCSTAEKTTKLAFNLPKGKVYEYVMDMTMSQEAQGQKGSTSIKGAYLMEVTDANDSLSTVRTTFDRLGMNMEMGGMKLDIDSDKADTASGQLSAQAMQANPMGAMQSLMGGMFRGMKGKSFTMVMDREGKVSSVSGLEEVASGMAGEMNVADDMRSTMQQAFAQQFNSEKMKDAFQSYNIYPNKEVKVGDSWERTATMSGIELKSKYTVKSIEGNSVSLAMTGDVANPQLKGTQSGTLLVDKNTGLILKGDIEQHFTGPVTINSKVSYSGKQRS